MSVWLDYCGRNNRFDLCYTSTKEVRNFDKLMGSIMIHVVNWGVKVINDFWPHSTATVVTLITALQWPQIRSIFRTINSLLLSLWRFVSRQSPTFTGRWLAVYTPTGGHGLDPKQVETVTCTHVTGNELTGSIQNENTKDKYSFGGHFVFDEVIDHYWPKYENNKDIGTFKMGHKSGSSDILSGVLTLYDSSAGVTKNGIYTWYRCPRWWSNWLLRLFKPARPGFGAIEGTGLFANVRFMEGDQIAIVKLGKESSQAKYTIFFQGKHYIVEKPWRFINHSCDPNARIDRRDSEIGLVALKEIFPQTEITCNYKLFEDEVREHFTCTCPQCRELVAPAKI